MYVSFGTDGRALQRLRHLVFPPATSKGFSRSTSSPPSGVRVPDFGHFNMCILISYCFIIYLFLIFTFVFWFNPTELTSSATLVPAAGFSDVSMARNTRSSLRQVPSSTPIPPWHFPDHIHRAATFHMLTTQLYVLLGWCLLVSWPISRSSSLFSYCGVASILCMSGIAVLYQTCRLQAFSQSDLYSRPLTLSFREQEFPVSARSCFSGPSWVTSLVPHLKRHVHIPGLWSIWL